LIRAILPFFRNETPSRRSENDLQGTKQLLNRVDNRSEKAGEPESGGCEKADHASFVGILRVSPNYFLNEMIHMESRAGNYL